MRSARQDGGRTGLCGRSGVELMRLYVQAGRDADARRGLRRLEESGAPRQYLAEARRLPGVYR